MKQAAPRLRSVDQHETDTVKLSRRRVNVDRTDSQLKGFPGLVEGLFRKFKVVSHAVMLVPLYFLGSILLGVAATPGILLVQWVWEVSQSWPVVPKALTLGISVGAAYYIYGFTLIFLMPFVNWLLRAKLKPFRGPYYSFQSIRWYIHNSATYLVRFTFLEFITPTPFSLMFFKMMGMKIGPGTIINTSYISDPSLIEMGEKVTIGGSVTLLAHYGVGGYLILSPVKIGNRVTVGLKASIMGGVEIGDDVRILPHSVVLPKTKIPAGEIWGGVPARKVED